MFKVKNWNKNWHLFFTFKRYYISLKANPYISCEKNKTRFEMNRYDSRTLCNNNVGNNRSDGERVDEDHDSFNDDFVRLMCVSS